MDYSCRPCVCLIVLSYRRRAGLESLAVQGNKVGLLFAQRLKKRLKHRLKIDALRLLDISAQHYHIADFRVAELVSDGVAGYIVYVNVLAIALNIDYRAVNKKLSAGKQ